MSKTSERKKKETRKDLAFSQMKAMSLLLEKIQRTQLMIESLNQERQQLLNQIANELGIKKAEFPKWNLSKEGNAFITSTRSSSLNSKTPIVIISGQISEVSIPEVPLVYPIEKPFKQAKQIMIIKTTISAIHLNLMYLHIVPLLSALSLPWPHPTAISS